MSRDDIITLLFVSILLFLLLREVNCWYWKINTRNALLKNIDKNLQIIVNNLKEEENDKNSTNNTIDNSIK